ncbi:uncharacterized protein DEA37_0001046 [Paragonimus westermani]|uniref:Leucine-rich repeat-containing protein 9 n=1 Tax=Paragonimus westermani TaxID=34504 RepID=A0A5J4NH57_9TREM|nr:uncharacterized protein DEA37_0001046 [Paragonimus westermani]
MSIHEDVEPLLHTADEQEEEIFRELCYQNGLHTEGFSTNIFAVENLHIVFSGLPHLVNLKTFPFLTELLIISQNLAKISHLDSVPNLKKLWICECKVTKIENVDVCENLEELYLYDNAIRSIENLENLDKLRVLFLNDNRIEVMQGLSTLENLEHLNLSNNTINSIDIQLKCNSKLSTLCLSGNNLDNLQNVLRLKFLPNLTSLTINEPGFRKNPVCENPNLPLVLLFFLPKLIELDNVIVNSPELRNSIECILATKQSFYMMKSQSIHSHFEDLNKTLKAAYYSISTKIFAQIRGLDKSMRLLQFRRSHTMKGEANLGDLDRSLCSSWIKELKLRIRFWECMLERYKFELQQSLKVTEKKEQLQTKLCQVELENFGFIEVTEIVKDGECFKQCSDIFASKICCNELWPISIIGVKILRIFKIVNRLLLRNFEEDGVLNADDTGKNVMHNEDYKLHQLRQQDYVLFVRPDENNELETYVDLIQSGKLSKCTDRCLTHCLHKADEKNLKELRATQHDIMQWNPKQFISLLILRIWQESTSQTIVPVLEDEPNLSHFKNNESCAEFKTFNERVQDTCRHRIKIWKSPDHLPLLPEFIIDVQYMNKLESTSPFYQILTGNNSKFVLPNLSEGTKTDLLILKQIPAKFLKSIPTGLTEETLETFIETRSPGKAENTILVVIDKCRIRLPNLQTFTNLKEIQLNHCNLRKVPPVFGLAVQVLNLSHNSLRNLNTLGSLPALKELDVSFNLLTDLPEELNNIQSRCSNLEGLCLKHNPWKKDKLMRIFTLTVLHNLTSVDEIPVTQLERDEAGLQISKQNMTLALISGSVSTFQVTSESCCYFTIDAVADYLLHWNLTFPLSKDYISWNSIISLCLKGINLRSVQEEIVLLINLRFVCLDDNYLTNLDNLSVCQNLEEISAHDNCLTSVEKLGILKKLRRLLVGKNFLTSFFVPEEGQFTSLEVLVLQSNGIKLLHELSACYKLKELYVGHNNITELKAIMNLKNLTDLTTIDLFGNPITKELKDYRARLIHYFKCLKSLDGREIQSTEVTQSKELLEGHLSHEFLMEKLEHDNFTEITCLDLQSCGIKLVDFLNVNAFMRLQSVNLEKNNLSSFGGLIFLPQIRILCLTENNIDSLFPQHICTLATSKHTKITDGIVQQYLTLYHSTQPIFPFLQVIHLAKNQIKSLQPFQFHRMPSLRSLFLQNNEITSVTGLEGLQQMRELVLDGNKIKEISGVSFLYNWSLQEIHLEYNRLRGLQQLNGVETLERLYVAGNKLTDLNDLEKFAESQKQLMEISLIDNPITMKRLHRMILIHGCSRIQIIDGLPVSSEERERCSAFYADLELQNLISSNPCIQNSPLNSQIMKSFPTTEPALAGIRFKKPALPILQQPGASLPTKCSGKTTYCCVNAGGQVDKDEAVAISTKSPRALQTKHSRIFTLHGKNCEQISSIGLNNSKHSPQCFPMGSARIEPEFHIPGMSILPVKNALNLTNCPKFGRIISPAEKDLYSRSVMQQRQTR